MAHSLAEQSRHSTAWGNAVRWMPDGQSMNDERSPFRRAGTSGRVDDVLAGRTLREALAAVRPFVLDQELVLGNSFPAVRALAEDGCV